ncbi:MAG: S-layer homology domain-containing protein [Leptolyngbyaceae cyanobacterium]
MTKLFLGIGLTLLGMGTIAPVALASEQTSHSAAADSPNRLASPDRVSPDSTVTPATAQSPLDLPSDVSPDHWAYTAVLNLTASYGCLSGYPDGTFRGDEFVTRYEFAAAMDACLSTLLQLVEQRRQVNLGPLLEDLADLETELGTLSDEVEEAASSQVESDL